MRGTISVVEKECLGMVWALQNLDKYLYGRQFVLETNHQPIKYLQLAKTGNSRLMKWALLLQPFRFRIEAIISLLLFSSWVGKLFTMYIDVFSTTGVVRRVDYSSHAI